MGHKPVINRLARICAFVTKRVEMNAVSKYLTPILSSIQPGKAALMDAIRAKNWSIRDAADYLGVSRQRLYTAVAEKNRARFWDLALLNLPECTQAIKDELAILRKGKPKKRRQQAKPPAVGPSAPTFELNDCLVAVSYSGIAEEGDEGWISAIEVEDGRTLYQVTMPDGTRWFDQTELDEYFQTTGLSKGPGI